MPQRYKLYLYRLLLGFALDRTVEKVLRQSCEPSMVFRFATIPDRILVSYSPLTTAEPQQTLLDCSRFFTKDGLHDCIQSSEKLRHISKVLPSGKMVAEYCDPDKAASEVSTTVDVEENLLSNICPTVCVP